MIDFDNILEQVRSYIENNTGFDIKDFPIFSERLIKSTQSEKDRVGLVYFDDTNPWNINSSKKVSLNFIVRFRFRLDRIRKPVNYTEATALSESYPILLRLIGMQRIPPGVQLGNITSSCGYDTEGRYNIESKLNLYQP